MLLIGNRWASYVVTPIPGFYLADLLFLLGSVLGVGNLGALRRAPVWVWVLFGSVWIYAALVLLPELFVVPPSDRYLAIRDASPYLYLSLAPLVALALMQVSARSLVWVVRWSSLAAAIIALLAAMGILEPTRTSFLGSYHVRLFESRPDLLGAAVGVGVIAWGAWEATRQGSYLAVQGLVLFIGAIAVENRSGLVALVAATVIATVRDYRRRRQLVVPIAVLLLLFAGLVVQMLGLPSVNGRDTTMELSENTTMELSENTTMELSEAFSSWFDSTIYRSGTIYGRVETWMLISRGLTRDSAWLLGGSAGSDYMYELCTGVAIAPDVLRDGDPKCPVDDAGPDPVVRDPHNWILNIALYHGLVGLVIFVAAFAIPAWKMRQTKNWMLPVGGLITYLVVGMTFLISAGYALIPMTVFIAWLVRNALEASRSNALNLK